MINFFRKTRYKLMETGKTGRYFKYAIGEIVLVVIGILIALQINTWNNNRIDRKKEVKYLTAIKQDLLKDIESTTYNIDFRKGKLLSTQKVIDQFNGLLIDNLTELSNNIVLTLYVERFQPSNITFKELVSSGSVNLISNDSIKKLLLELELLYQKNIFGIEHETFEYQEYISKSVFKDLNIQTLKQLFNNEKTAEELNIKREDFEELLQNKEYINGCAISNWTSEEMIGLLEAVEKKSEKIIEFIKIELENNSN